MFGQKSQVQVNMPPQTPFPYRKYRKKQFSTAAVEQSMNEWYDLSRTAVCKAAEPCSQHAQRQTAQVGCLQLLYLSWTVPAPGCFHLTSQ